MMVLECLLIAKVSVQHNTLVMKCSNNHVVYNLQVIDTSGLSKFDQCQHGLLENTMCSMHRNLNTVVCLHRPFAFYSLFVCKSFRKHLWVLDCGSGNQIYNPSSQLCRLFMTLDSTLTWVHSTLLGNKENAVYLILPSISKCILKKNLAFMLNRHKSSY